MTDAVICGIRGRMGRTLVSLAAERDGLRIVGGLDHDRPDDTDDNGPDVPVAAVDDAARVLARADVVIDFSAASATRTLLEVAGGHLAGKALVVGTTGLDDATERMLDELSGRAAVLTAANFSVGVNLMLSMCERVSAALDPASYDAEIVEAHHARKVDAPSGTALALAEAVARGRDQTLARVRCDGRSGETGRRPVGEIGMHAVRGGDIVGEHTVMFIGQRERLELRHIAQDRSLFAEGALVAAGWLAGREPGRYTMRDVLNL